ncbi:Vps53-like domain-containing protein [Tieghemostelium lacteum]|uniref:Vps53-like domain-containing protein n=1 Tax=Tieghemostelium lacteum TaxID=361077 RepID=A0A151ZAE1_TIELA|nr:Vps53-like domain-containing protein [Tieghemostelium lacteum]|eukprot:KYQ90916.1 Vps53-like domain-containing protein [Tieghemostelium lacteum]
MSNNSSPISNSSHSNSIIRSTISNEQQPNITEWNNNMFSAELKAAINDIVPITDKDFDKHDFDPITYINDNFPTEQSLTSLDHVVNKLKVKIMKIDDEIIQAIRLQSTSGGKGKEDLENAKKSIQELLNKIRDIKSKAIQSEQIVTEICKDIKTLDYAKKNLTTAITTLKKLHMMVLGVEQLKDMAEKKQYATVAKLLEATAQLSDGFKDYRNAPKISSLNRELDMIRSRVKDQIYEDFKHYIPYTGGGGGGGGGQSQGGSGSKGEENRWRASCYVINALGSEMKKDFLRWFCDIQLTSYKSAFSVDSEHYQLESTERRFAWLARQLNTFRNEYAGVFPPEWSMEEQIAFEFCIATRLALSEILKNQNKQSIDVAVLLRAVKKTLEFERKLYEMFATNINNLPTSPVVTPQYGSEDGDYQSPQYRGMHDMSDKDDDDNDDDDDLDLETVGQDNPNSEENIKKRWIMREEKQKRKEMEKKNLVNSGVGSPKSITPQQASQPPSYERFKGIISTCFDPYMDLYVEQEDKYIQEKMGGFLQNEKWQVEDEGEKNKVLSSSSDMVYLFIKLMDRCSSLSKNEPYFNLYHLFRKYLSQYASAMGSKIQVDHITNSRIHDIQEDKLLYLIINTGEYCRKTAQNMQESFINTIGDRYKDQINLHDIQNEFSAVISKAAKSIVTGLESKIDPHLLTMTKIDWANKEDQFVGDNSPYANEIITIITETFALAAKWIPDHYSYFCDLFAASFAQKVTQYIYKCNKISETGSHCIQLDITLIKTALLTLPKKGKERYGRLVNKEFTKVENILKVISYPKESLVETYNELFPGSSDVDFQKIMDLKGMKSNDKTELLEKYINKVDKTITSIKKFLPVSLKY